MRFRFLGTGGSLGVPIIGRQSEVPKEHYRLRSAGLIDIEGKRFLIDTGPDLRQQALTNGIDHIDGVILTHAHYDHLGGFDDLRPFTFKRTSPLPILLSKATMEEVKIRYHYLIEPQQRRSFHHSFLFDILEAPFGETSFCGVSLSYLSYRQTGMEVTGYRFGDFAYVTDIQEYTDEVFDALEGVTRLVISALRWDTSNAHFSVADAIAFGERVGAERLYFTHLAHDIPFDAPLPPHAMFAYDGLEVV
jgi:phosphoribosyl 1,2-cyclic phosphate phosphodiesterase